MPGNMQACEERYRTKVSVSVPGISVHGTQLQELAERAAASQIRQCCSKWNNGLILYKAKIYNIQTKFSQAT